MNVNKAIEQERIKLLYEFCFKGIPFNILIGVVAYLFLFNKVPHQEINLFLSNIIFIAIARMAHAKYIIKKATWLKSYQQAKIGFIIGVLLQSCSWGVWYLFFIDHLSIESQYFIILLLSGLTAGSVATMSALPMAFFSFALPILLIPASYYVLHLNMDNLPIAAIILLYTVGISFSYVRTHDILLKSVKLALERQDLITQLEHSNAKITEISLTDELTQVANRRHFITTFDKEWKRNQRTKTDLSLLMIDIDFFKNYNDALGHQAGDECLRQVANIIAMNLKRSGDLLARYGGEEFVCILPNTPTQGAMNVAKLISESFAKEQIAHPNSSIANYVTVSIGIASIIPSPQTTPNQLLAQADKQLYLAKMAGRNQAM